MEIGFAKGKITLNREEFEIDKFTYSFVSVLDELKIPYVLVSGYVALAFGRSRNTEDVDIIVERIPFQQFEQLWRAVETVFECINAKEAGSAYEEYLRNDTAIRFSYKGRFIPNVEFKFPKTHWDRYTLKNRLELILNGKTLWISPMELQIAFKGYLGSDKDLEDARFLYRFFKNNIDGNEVARFMEEFKVSKGNRKYILSELK